jgi:hypothetical protein
MAQHWDSLVDYSTEKGNAEASDGLSAVFLALQGLTAILESRSSMQEDVTLL